MGHNLACLGLLWAAFRVLWVDLEALLAALGAPRAAQTAHRGPKSDPRPRTEAPRGLPRCIAGSGLDDRIFFLNLCFPFTAGSGLLRLAEAVAVAKAKKMSLEKLLLEDSLVGVPINPFKGTCPVAIHWPAPGFVPGPADKFRHA